MEEAQNSRRDDALASAQRLRFGRVLRGTLSFACTAAIVGACWAWNFLDGIRAVHYVIAVVAINGIALAAIASGWNLRLKDPSLTTPLVLSCLPPSISTAARAASPRSGSRKGPRTSSSLCDRAAPPPHSESAPAATSGTTRSTRASAAGAHPPKPRHLLQTVSMCDAR